MLSFFIVYSINAQPISNTYISDVQYFTIEDGLSHRAVISVFEDKDGIIWLGTPNGLNRFDGDADKENSRPTTTIYINTIIDKD